MNAPICCKCKKQSIKADAALFGSIPYWYCKSCKVELTDNGYPIQAKNEQLEDQSLKRDIETMESEGLAHDDDDLNLPQYLYWDKSPNRY